MPRTPPHKPLTDQEIADAIDPEMYPPMLTAAEAARLLRISKGTLYNKVSAGEFARCVKRGKPLTFWRDRLIKEYWSQ